MTVGTKSLLFGVHQFAWHPFTVARAWCQLYGKWPAWKEWVCIIVHDWGYWGCAEMDGPQGSDHSARGAKIADRLFGVGYWYLVRYHSRSQARKDGEVPSKLCHPDKFSMMFDPPWFYLLRARLSGEIREYHRRAIESGFIQFGSTQDEWLHKLRHHLAEKSRQEAANHL